MQHNKLFRRKFGTWWNKVDSIWKCSAKQLIPLILSRRISRATLAKILDHCGTKSSCTSTDYEFAKLIDLMLNGLIDHNAIYLQDGIALNMTKFSDVQKVKTSVHLLHKYPRLVKHLIRC